MNTLMPTLKSDYYTKISSCVVHIRYIVYYTDYCTKISSCVVRIRYIVYYTDYYTKIRLLN